MQLPGVSTNSLDSGSKIDHSSNHTQTDGAGKTKHITFSEFLATLRDKSKQNENSDVPLETILQDKQSYPYTTSKKFGNTKTHATRGKYAVGKRQDEDKVHDRNTQRNILSFISPTSSFTHNADVRETSTRICVPDEAVDIEEAVPQTFDLKLTDNIFQNTRYHFYLPRVDDVQECTIQLITDYSYFPVQQCLEQLRLCHKDTNSCSVTSDSKNLLWPDKYAPTNCSGLLYNGPNFARLKRWLERWKSLTVATQKSKKTEVTRLSVDKQNRVGKPKGNRRNRADNNEEEDDDDDFVPQRPTAKRRRTSPFASNQRPNSPGSLPHPTGLIQMPLGWPTSKGFTGNKDDSETDSELSDASISDMDGVNSIEDEDSCSNASHRPNWRSTVYIILGPPGTGKTAMVYALANDLGFKVFELNPSVRRSGKDLSDQFQVALDSHHVAKEHLKSSFSTFHMTGSLKLTGENIDVKKSRKSHSSLNFFQPRMSGVKVPKKRTMNKSADIKHSEAPKGLNLSCNSLVLLDEVDVLFDSDRGFWTGLDHLLQLGRRPIVLTASDPSFLHGISISARICHVKPPDKKLAIPYLRSVCLSEGYQLDAASAERLCRESSMASQVDSRVCSPASSHLDLRRLLIELQWFSLSSSSVSQHKSNPVSVAPGAPNSPPILTINSGASLLDRLPDLCPLLCSLTMRAPTPRNDSAVSKSDVNKPNAISLVDVFDEEPIPEKNQPVPVDSQSGTQPSIAVTPEPIVLPSVVRFIPSALKELRSLCTHWSQLEAYSTSFYRVILAHNLNAPEAQIAPNSNDVMTCSNIRVPNAGCAMATAAITRSTCTTTVNPLMTRLTPPVEPFDQSYRDLFEGVWPQTLSQWTVERLSAIEQAVQRESGLRSQYCWTGSPTSKSSSSYLSWNILSQSASHWKLGSKLSAHGVGGPAFKQFSRCGRRALACDYLPCLRTLASGEATKQVVLNKRRFFHYFDRINLHMPISTREALAKPVFLSSKSD